MTAALVPNQDVPFWAVEQIKLRRTFADWVDAEIASAERQPLSEKLAGLRGHAADEAGGVSRSWVGFYFLTGEERIPAYLRALWEAWRAATAEHMYHGFPANQRGDHVLHTAETFTHFLLNMLYMDRGDRLAVDMVEDAAEHLGNWSDEVYPWYDWDRHRFRSYFLGTRNPQFARPPLDWQSITHFRLLAIAVAAYEATGKQRYLDLLVDYSDMWAEAILAAKTDREIPRKITDLTEEQFNEFARQDPKSIHPVRDWIHEFGGGYARRAGLGRGGGMPGDLSMTMLEVYRHTGISRYRDALHRVFRLWIKADEIRPSQLTATEPHSSFHYLKYRDFTGDQSFDSLYLERFPVGVTAAIITGQTDRMLGMASASAAVFDHLVASNSGKWGKGRVVTHGCDSKSNSGGACSWVMPVLHLPVFGGMTVHYGRPPWMNVAYYTAGKLALPADVAAFCSPSPQNGRVRVRLCNTGSAPTAVTVRAVNPAARDRGELRACPPADGRSVVEVPLPPLGSAIIDLARPE